MVSDWKYIIDPGYTFINTEKLIKKEYVISVSVSAYALTGFIISVSNSVYKTTAFIIPPSLINTGHLFQCRAKPHARCSHIAVSSVCFQTRHLLVDLLLKHDKNKYKVNMNEGEITKVTHYTRSK